MRSRPSLTTTGKSTTTTLAITREHVVRCHRRLAEARDEILADIEDRTGCDVLNLPMLTDYYIDLEFPVVNSDRFARESLARRTDSATRISEEATGGLSALEAEPSSRFRTGSRYRRRRIAISPRTWGMRSRCVAAVERLLESGCLKRIGCVINHVVTGFDANRMVVWDVPDESLDEQGRACGRTLLRDALLPPTAPARAGVAVQPVHDDPRSRP